MNKIQKVMFVIVLFILGIIIGIFLSTFEENYNMGNYQLYNCLYNNANSNGFPKDSIMIEKIENECICFKQHNYTNLIESNCSWGEK